MRMRRWISLALAAVLALAVAAVAVAHKSGGAAKPTEPAAATFTASPVADKTRTRTCTGVDGTYAITKAVYEGTSTGDARLTGNIVIKAKSVVNQDNGLGHSEGKVFVRDATTNSLKAVAGFTAVNTERGVLNGLLTGKVKDQAASARAKKNRGRRGHDHGTNLVANFSAAFNAEGTQLSGELGGGAAQNTAVYFGEPCQPEQPTTAPQGQAGDDDDNRHGGRGHNDDDDRKGGRRGDDDRK